MSFTTAQLRCCTPGIYRTPWRGSEPLEMCFSLMLNLFLELSEYVSGRSPLQMPSHSLIKLRHEFISCALHKSKEKGRRKEQCHELRQWLLIFQKFS